MYFLICALGMTTIPLSWAVVEVNEILYVKYLLMLLALVKALRTPSVRPEQRGLQCGGDQAWGLGLSWVGEESVPTFPIFYVS
jgi:hypothetical protein